MKKAGVYGIRCKSTNKWYVGAGVDVDKRIKDHFYAMRTWPNENQMSRDAKLYGLRDMEHVILEYVENKLYLHERESYWIDYLDSMSNGYNSQSSGNNRFWR